MTKHTEGPWFARVEVASVRLGANGLAHKIVKGGRSYVVAFSEEVTGDVVHEPAAECGAEFVRSKLINPRGMQREIHPDARLISASPDLLEALQEILRQLPSRANAKSAGYGRDRDRCYYLRRLSVQSVVAARAAVAKATGGD